MYRKLDWKYEDICLADIKWNQNTCKLKLNIRPLGGNEEDSALLWDHSHLYSR